jgi:NAD-reducing hydrogenase large subunit
VNEYEEKLELYRSRLRFVDSSRQKVLVDFDRNDYLEYIGETAEDFSFLKSPYYKPMGYPDGIYRAEALARLNVIKGIGTPEADHELLEYKDRNLLSNFYNHYARLIECLNALEQIERLLDEPDILNQRVRAHASANVEEGIGVSEAPLGTLIYHYKSIEFNKGFA